MRRDWLDGRTLALFRADAAFRGEVVAWALDNATGRALVAASVVAIELALPPLLLARTTRSLGVALALPSLCHQHWAVSVSPVSLVSPGDRIKVGDSEGVVVRVSAVAVIVASARGEHVLPCSLALRRTMEIRRLGTRVADDLR